MAYVKYIMKKLIQIVVINFSGFVVGVFFVKT